MLDSAGLSESSNRRQAKNGQSGGSPPIFQPRSKTFLSSCSLFPFLLLFHPPHILSRRRLSSMFSPQKFEIRLYGIDPGGEHDFSSKPSDFLPSLLAATPKTKTTPCPSSITFARMDRRALSQTLSFLLSPCHPSAPLTVVTTGDLTAFFAHGIKVLGVLRHPFDPAAPKDDTASQTTWAQIWTTSEEEVQRCLDMKPAFENKNLCVSLHSRQLSYHLDRWKQVYTYCKDDHSTSS